MWFEYAAAETAGRGRSIEETGCVHVARGGKVGHPCTVWRKESEIEKMSNSRFALRYPVSFAIVDFSSGSAFAHRSGARACEPNGGGRKAGGAESLEPIRRTQLLGT